MGPEASTESLPPPVLVGEEVPVTVEQEQAIQDDAVAGQQEAPTLVPVIQDNPFFLPPEVSPPDGPIGVASVDPVPDPIPDPDPGDPARPQPIDDAIITVRPVDVLIEDKPAIQLDDNFLKIDPEPTP